MSVVVEHWFVVLLQRLVGIFVELTTAIFVLSSFGFTISKNNYKKPVAELVFDKEVLTAQKHRVRHVRLPPNHNIEDIAVFRKYISLIY